MKILLLLLAILGSFSSNADECKGHIVFFNLQEGLGESDTDTDFSYYYHEVAKWLPEKGLSYSAHTKLPLKAKTCFSNEVTIPSTLLNDPLGYVLVRPNSEKKYIGGVLTDSDMRAIIIEFFE
jgi:hypothetical protein